MSGVIRAGAGRMVPSESEKREWARMAAAAYGADLNAVGHRFSGAAALRVGESLPIAWFDALQSEYRAWLIGGFAVRPAIAGEVENACRLFYWFRRHVGMGSRVAYVEVLKTLGIYSGGEA